MKPTINQMKSFFLALVISAITLPGYAQTYAIKGQKVYQVSGPVIENGVVIVRDGKIAEVGPESRVRIPAGVEVTEAVVVTPGFIDARSVVGLAGALNIPGSDQDQLERSSPFQPELRAIDAYNAREFLVEWASTRDYRALQG